MIQKRHSTLISFCWTGTSLLYQLPVCSCYKYLLLIFEWYNLLWETIGLGSDIPHSSMYNLSILCRLLNQTWAICHSNTCRFHYLEFGVPNFGSTVLECYWELGRAIQVRTPGCQSTSEPVNSFRSDSFIEKKFRICYYSFFRYSTVASILYNQS